MTTTSPSLIWLAVDRLERLVLRIEDARRTLVVEPLVAEDLDHRAVRRDVALEDDQTAGLLDRLVDRARPHPDRAFRPRWPPPRRRSRRWRSADRRAACRPRSCAGPPAACRRPCRDRRRRSGRPASCRRSAACGARSRRSRRSSSSTPASRASASRWSTALVEPPLAATPAIAFSNASRVRMSRGRMPLAAGP